MPTILISQQGEWLEIDDREQSTWLVDKGSRVTSLVLFVNLVSAIDANKSKRCLIFLDQVKEQDYRRLCRMILFQQQLTLNDKL